MSDRVGHVEDSQELSRESDWHGLSIDAINSTEHTES